MTELAVVPDVPAISSRSGVRAVGRCGIELDDDIRFNDWRDVLEAALQMADGALWIVADCAAFGLKKLRLDPSWAIYSTMIEAKYTRQALYDLAMVARKIEISRRREILSLTHHREVAALEPDEQDAWLNDAITHNWSTRELRDELKGFSDRDRQPTEAISLRLVDEHYGFVLEAAERRDMDPRDWVLEAIREKRDRELVGLEAA